MALTFLDSKAIRWYALAMPRSDRPANWTLFEVRLVEHYAPCSAAGAMYRLRQVKQSGTIRDYIDQSNEALTDCGNIHGSES